MGEGLKKDACLALTNEGVGLQQKNQGCQRVLEVNMFKAPPVNPHSRLLEDFITTKAMMTNPKRSL